MLLQKQSTDLHGLHLKDFEWKYFMVVLSLGIIFAFVGGYVNAICFSGLWMTGLTHLTGLTTNSAITVVNPPPPPKRQAIEFWGYIFAFFLGSFFAGLVLGPPRLRWRSLQGICVGVQGLALLLAWRFAGEVFGGCCICFAFGLQNAITSNFTPMTIRTSHVTGTVLDAGVGLGQTIHCRSMKYLWKVKVNFPVFFSFWFGALGGTSAWVHLGKDALIIPFCFLLVWSFLTLLWCFVRKYLLRIIDPVLEEEYGDGGGYSPLEGTPLVSK